MQYGSKAIEESQNADMQMIEDAANFWACGIETDGRPQPTITSYHEVEHEDGDILQIIKVDTLAYSRQHDTRAVRMNVSLPTWMAYQVEQREINCSQVLQDALKQVLS